MFDVIFIMGAGMHKPPRKAASFVTAGVSSVLVTLGLLVGSGANAQVEVDWAQQTWDPPGTGNLSETYNIGGGNVTFTFGGNTAGLADPTSPSTNTFNTGGLVPPEPGLFIGTDYLDQTDPQVTLTIDFDHLNGVGVVGFTIFDLDGAGTFVDRVAVTACTDAADPVCDEIRPTSVMPGSVNEVFLQADGTDPFVVDGAPNVGSAFDSDAGNTEFVFDVVGIRKVVLTYANIINVPNPGFQAITLHNVGFVPTQIADLSLDKTVDNPTPPVGSIVTFTLTVNNDGPSPATGVEVTDVLPGGFEYESDNSGGTFDPNNGIWQVGNIAAGDSATLTLMARVLPVGPYINGAEITRSEQLDPDSTPGGGPPDEDDIDTVAVVPVGAAGPIAVDDFALTGQDEPVDIDLLGNDIGDEPLSIDTVSDPPNGTAVIDDNGTPNDPSDDFIVYTPDPGFIGVEMFPYTITDVNGLPAEAIVTVLVGPAFLNLTKAVTPAQALPGELVSYTVTVENIGPVSIPAVSLQDMLPAGFTYVASSVRLDGSAGGVTESGFRPVLFSGFPVDAGQTRTLTYLARVGAGVIPGDYTNTVLPVPLIGNMASAVVSITTDPDFEQTTIVGKVFNDLNGDGWQDEDEHGIAGVRLATVQGLLVETDSHGRYHIAAVDGGFIERGRNFIIKVDPHTLPRGSGFTTENPRVLRVTQGLLNRIDFGVRLPGQECCEEIEVKLAEMFFKAGSSAIEPRYYPALIQFADRLRKHGGGTLTIEGQAQRPGTIDTRTVVDFRSESRTFNPQFGVRRWDLNAQDRQALDVFASELAGLTNVRIKAVGHTSGMRIAPAHTNEVANNCELSRRRASEVASYMASRLGVNVLPSEVACDNDPPLAPQQLLQIGCPNDVIADRIGTCPVGAPADAAVAAVGCGPYVPLVCNLSPPDRSVNRRVDLTISGELPTSSVVNAGTISGGWDTDLARARARAVFEALRDILGDEMMRELQFELSGAPPADSEPSPSNTQPLSDQSSSETAQPQAAVGEPSFGAGVLRRMAQSALQLLVPMAHAQNEIASEQISADKLVAICSAEACATDAGYPVQIITHESPRAADPKDTPYTEKNLERVDVSGRFSVRMSGGGEVWATEDASEATRRLAITGPEQLPIVYAESGAALGPVAPFFAYTNYSAFIDRGEIRFYRADDDDRVRPLMVVPATLQSLTRIDPPTSLLDSVAIAPALSAPLRAGDELAYVLRVYDAGGRFDETAPRRLLVVGENEYTPPSATAVQRNLDDSNPLLTAADGEVPLRTPLNGNVLVFQPREVDLHHQAREYTLTPRFDTRRTALALEDRQALDSIAAEWTDAVNTHVHVVGHTDNVRIAPQHRNEFKDNIELSQARAWAVANYLRDRLGLTNSNISARGMGESDPVASNESTSGRALNRRVQLRITGEQRIEHVIGDTRVTLVDVPGENEAVVRHSIDEAEVVIDAQRGNALRRDRTALATKAMLVEQAYALSAQESTEVLNAIYGKDQLVLRTIPIRGSRVRLQGRDLDGHSTLFIDDGPVPLDQDGYFASEYLMPVGEHVFQVERGDVAGGIRESKTIAMDVTGKHMFLVAIADITLSDNDVGGNIEPLSVNDRYNEEDLLVEGRLAFYLKGKVKGKYLITAQLDSTEEQLENLFDNIDEKNPQSVFRRLDPDRYYPVYGDDSTLVSDTDTQGRFYVRVDWDNSKALWGNYHTGFTGTEFAQYNRSLYGAKVHHKGADVTQYGEHRLELQGFVSEVQTALGHSEFRGTGGSVYYLRHRDILPGSEKVHVEIRDRDSTRVIENETMVRGRDYEVDELQGRIILSRPLMQVSRMLIPDIVRDQPLDGNDVIMLVDYEYVPDGFDANQVAYGGRGRYWINDNIAVGATVVEESRGAEDYTMQGGDVIVRKGRGSYVKLEVASTEAAQSERFLSDDGGMSFVQSAGVVPGREGDAFGVEARVDTREMGWTERDWTGAIWYRDTDGDYSVARRELGVDTEEFGFEVVGQVTDKLELAARANIIDRAGTSEDQRISLQVDYDFSSRHNLAGELRFLSEQDPRQPAQPEVDASLVALRYTYGLNSYVDLFGTAQITLDDDGGRYDENDLLSVGARMRLSDRTTLMGEVSSGDRGEGALVALDHQVSDKHWIYGTYTHSSDRTSVPEGDQIALGHRSQISNQTTLFNEAQFQNNVRFSGLAHIFGLDFAPSDAWNFGVTLQTGEFESIDGGAIDRDAVGGSAAFQRERIKARARVEYRNDNGASDVRQWLASTRVDYSLNEDLRALAKVNWSESTDQRTTAGNAKFTEATIGLAYRPVENDKLNVLAKYTFLYDLPGLNQVSTGVDQRSQIMSVEGIYRIARKWELGGKLARRTGELRTERAVGDWFESTTDFGAVRARYHMIHNWDGLLEYRVLSVQQAQSTRNGMLAAVDRHIGDHLKLGIGYNFTDFSDDLADFDYDHSGWFLNAVGKY